VFEEIHVDASRSTNEPETTAPDAAALDVPLPCVACDEPCPHYSLDKARSGDELEIVHVDDEHARIQCLRFGMAEGARVTCVTRIPAGPLVLKSGRQEIAVGRQLAKRIRVRTRSGDLV
jgi:Fe2+ transport system protein FeoA